MNENSNLRLPIVNDGSIAPCKDNFYRSTAKEKAESNIANTVPSSSHSNFIKKIKFHRLGYITFDNNMKTNYRARELKSISLNIRATYIKLIIHACHGYDNKLNQDTRCTNGSISENNNSISGSRPKENKEIMREKKNPFYQVGIVNLELLQMMNFHPSSGRSNIVQEMKEKQRSDAVSTTTTSVTTSTSSTQNKGRVSIGTNTTLLDDILKNDSNPSTTAHRQQGTKNTNNLKPMNSNDIIDFQSRVAKMEQVMRKMAGKEVRQALQTTLITL